MSLSYEVTGYDRRTDRQPSFLEVPERRVPSVLRAAGIPVEDDGLGSYRLTADQVTEIATILETRIDGDDRDYFLEPYPTEPRQAAG